MIDSEAAKKVYILGKILFVLGNPAALRAADRRIPGNPASWAALFVYSGGSRMVGLVTMSD